MDVDYLARSKLYSLTLNDVRKVYTCVQWLTFCKYLFIIIFIVIVVLNFHVVYQLLPTVYYCTHEGTFKQCSFDI